jgi:DNA-binding NarL/FixJ family response regulator
MSKIKIAIAEDHKKYRETIVGILNQEHDFEVILQAENGKQLIEKLEIALPDIVLMDIRMPQMNGIETTRKLKTIHPDIKVIALSQYDDDSNIIEMNTHGVKSFINKNNDLKELFKAIRIVSEGAVYMTSHSAIIIQRHLTNKSQEILSFKLSEFEKFLISAICNGDSSNEIGRYLNRSSRTIEEHRENLYKKFGVRTKEEFLREVYKRNLI